MAELHVELVAADRKVWSGEARIVIAKTAEGDLGVLPGHEPVLAVLAPGAVTIRGTDGADVVAVVAGGFLSVNRDNVSVLAEDAEFADRIDLGQAEEALRRAEQEGDDAGAAAARARISAANRAGR